MVRIAAAVQRRRGTWLELVPERGEGLRLPVQAVPSWAAEGAVLDDAQWTALRSESDFQLLFDTAVRILGRREHFAEELRRKLAQRSFDRQLVGRVLDACRSKGYLDDSRAADALAERLTRRGGIGPSYLCAELRGRGCPVELVEAVLTQYSPLLDEGATARELLEKRRGSLTSRTRAALVKLQAKGETDPRRVRHSLRQKLALAVLSLLQSRGLGSDEAKSAARRLVDELVEDALAQR